MRLRDIFQRVRDRDREATARRTLDVLMSATVDSMIGDLSIDEIMVKHFTERSMVTTSRGVYDWNRPSMNQEDLKRVREYLIYIYAMERVST